MQGFKKSLVALLLVAAMVLTAIVPAFAATEPAKKEVLSDAAARLIALGIVKGDDKGKVNEDQPVTRAEAAAMVVRALNMETAADLQKGQTKFADVNADAGLQWATGIINVAVSQGIINGYPDGRFDGRGNVTYAQFAKMLVYALNYGVTVEGGVWPTAVLAKADELGLTKKVSVVADAAMTRGAVIRMVDNALTVPTLKQTGYGDVSIYDPTGETLLAKLGLDELEGRIVEIPQVAKGLAKNQITMWVQKVNGETDEDEDTRINSYETLDVMEGVDAQGYFGYKVIAWVNDDDEILYVQPKTKDTDIMVDVIDKFKEKNKVTLLVADKDYKFSEKVRKNDVETKIYINDESEDLEEFFKRTTETDSCKLYGRFIKDGDEIVFAYLFDFEKSGVITKADENGFEYFDKGGNTRKIKYSDYDHVIFLDKNLQAASVDDVEKDGVAYWYEDTDDDELYLVVSAPNKVEGKLESAREDEMYINGKKYKCAKPFGNAGTTVSSNENEDIERWWDNGELADEVEDLTGTNVIAILDIVGRVRHVVGDSEAGSGDQYGVATDAYQTGREYMLRIMGKDGKEVAYPVEKRSDWEPYRKYFENEFKDAHKDNTPYLPVKYKLNGNGEIKEQELFLVAGPVGPFATSKWNFNIDKDAKKSTATFDGKEEIVFNVVSDELFYGAVSEFDDDDDYIDVYKASGADALRTGKHYVENKTVIMNLALDDDEWDDPEVLEWNDIKSKNMPKDRDVFVVGYNIPDAKLVVFVENFDDVKDDEEFGVTVEKPTYDGSDWWVKVDVAGKGVKEYKIDDWYGKNKDGFGKGHLIGFTVNSSNKLKLATFDEARAGRGSGHDLGAEMWFKRIKADVQKAVQVFDDGDYLELGPVGASKHEYKLKIARDAVVYSLDKDYDVDKKLDYTDIDVDDKILFLEDESDIIRAVLIVTKCYDVEKAPKPGDPVTGGTVTYINKEVKLGTDEVLKITLPADNTEVYTVVVLGEDGTPASTSGKKTLVTKTFTATDLIPAPGTVNAVYAVKVLDAKGNVVKDSESIVRNIDKDAPTVTSATLTDYAPAEVKQADAGNIVVKNKKAAAVGFKIVAPTSGAVDQPLKVTVDTSGTDPLVKVELATDASGNLATTWAQIVNAVNGNNDAKELVELSLKDAAKADEVAAAAAIANVDANTAATPASIKVVFTQGMDTSITATKVTIDGVVYNGTVVWDSNDTNNKTADIELDAEIKLTGKKLEAINLVKANGTPVVIATPVDLN